MPELNDPEVETAVVEMRRMTDEMIAALTSPFYVEAMRQIMSASDEDRLNEASRRLSPEGLKEMGVPIPPGMRISSRYFEKGMAEMAEFGDIGEEGGESTNDLTLAAIGGCTCGGSRVPPFVGPVVCGGAGVVF
jgi:hypothetical protein